MYLKIHAVKSCGRAWVLVVWFLASTHPLYEPAWQEGVVGVSVQRVGHVSVGFPGEQIHQAAMKAIFFTTLSLFKCVPGDLLIKIVQF